MPSWKVSFVRRDSPLLGRGTLAGGIENLPQSRSMKEGFLFQPGAYVVETLFRFEVAKEEGPFASHYFAVPVHYAEIGAYQGREVGFVDDHEIRVLNSGASFARDLVAFGDVNDVDESVDEFWREGCGEIVAPAFYENDLSIGIAVDQIFDRRHIHAGIVADRGVRAAAGFYAEHAMRFEGVVAG